MPLEENRMICSSKDETIGLLSQYSLTQSYSIQSMC